MMNVARLFAAASVFAVAVSGSALAEPASSSAAGISGVALLNANTAYSGILLSTTLKTSEQKDIIAGVSLECGLYTRTRVKGQKGEADSATAEAKVEVRVLIDAGTAEERVAAPGWVTFCSRKQQLSSVLGGVLESCNVSLTDNDGDGIPDTGYFTKDDCEFTDEEIQLVLETMNANHFNFMLTDLGASGVNGHAISVETRVTEGGDGDYDANALIGKGSLTVDEVRFVKDFQL